MRRTLAAGDTFEGHAINYRKDGSPLLLGRSVVPIFNDFGQKVAWLSLQSDDYPTAPPSLGERAVTLGRKLHVSGGR